MARNSCLQPQSSFPSHAVEHGDDPFGFCGSGAPAIEPHQVGL
jgi:hypothetical protein